MSEDALGLGSLVRSELAFRVSHLIRRVSYKPGYRFQVNDEYTGDGPAIARVRVAFDRPDTFTGELGTGFSPSVPIFESYTDGDIVRTLFGLVKALEEHECREAFQVDGSRVFGPHIELEALIEAGRRVQGHV